MMKLYAKKTPHGYYIVNERGQAVHRDGSLAYHPVPCSTGEYPEYKPTTGQKG
jgi:hypothetical protein